MKPTRKVFNKELNSIIEEVDIEVTCNNWDLFFSVWDIETLEKMKTTQLNHENYEYIPLIQKHIDLKHNNKNGNNK